MFSKYKMTRVILGFLITVIIITLVSRASISVMSADVITCFPYETKIRANDYGENVIEEVDHKTCVPIGSLVMDEDENFYIYVLEESDNVVGVQMYATKIPVDVLDRDDMNVAVDGIDETFEVIIQSSKPLDDGSYVKRQLE